MDPAGVEGHAPAWALKNKTNMYNRYRAKYYINGDSHTQYIEAETQEQALGKVPQHAEEIQITQMSVEEIMFYELRSIKGAYERQKAKLRLLYRYDADFRQKRNKYLRDRYRKLSCDPVIAQVMRKRNHDYYLRNREHIIAHHLKKYYERKAKANSEQTAND